MTISGSHPMRPPPRSIRPIAAPPSGITPTRGGHPDAFARVQRAVAVLRDPDKRSRYDRDGTIDDGPDQSRSLALEILGKAFQAAIGEAKDIAAIDIVADIRRRIEKTKAKAGLMRHIAADELRQANDALGRLKHKGKSPDFLRSMLQQRRETIERESTRIEAEIAACRAALDLAADYSWTFEPGRGSDVRAEEGGRTRRLVEELEFERFKASFGRWRKGSRND